MNCQLSFSVVSPNLQPNAFLLMNHPNNCFLNDTVWRTNCMKLSKTSGSSRLMAAEQHKQTCVSTQNKQTLFAGYAGGYWVEIFILLSSSSFFKAPHSSFRKLHFFLRFSNTLRVIWNCQLSFDSKISIIIHNFWLRNRNKKLSVALFKFMK